MPHPLQQFDNQKTPAFHLNFETPLFFRIITTPESAKLNEKTAEALGPIAFETQNRLIISLKKTYPEIDKTWFVDPKNEKTPEKEIKWKEEVFPQKFEQDNNYTALSLEDEAGNVLCATSFMINDQATREIFRLSQEQAPHIFFDLSQTRPDHGRHGLLKTVRNFLIPQILVEAGFENCYYANAMKAMTATNPEDKKIIYDSIPNFIPHNKIFKFSNEKGEVSVLPRYQKDDRDFSDPKDDFVSSALFCRDEGNLDEDMVFKFIKTHKEKAKEMDAKFEGIFMMTEIKDLQKLLEKSRKELLQEKDGVVVIKGKPVKPEPEMAMSSVKKVVTPDKMVSPPV